jgi:hypothetical protein
MKIEGIILLREVVDKLSLKHGVETYEVEEMLNGEPKIRFVEFWSGRAKIYTWL